jgi:hypothetical protein
MDGTYVNGVTLGGSGPNSGSVAAEFDGTNDYVSLPDDSRDYSNGVTVALWARPATSQWWARFVDLGNGAPSNNIFFTRAAAGTTLQFAIYNGGAGTTKSYVDAAGALTQDEWHHYAATVDSNGLAKMYKDAVELTITSGSSGYPTIGLPNNVTRTLNYVGRSNWSADPYYQGKMWDVRVYNRCLCTAEIQALYDAGVENFPGVKIIKWIELQ